MCQLVSKKHSTYSYDNLASSNRQSQSTHGWISQSQEACVVVKDKENDLITQTLRDQKLWDPTPRRRVWTRQPKLNKQQIGKALSKSQHIDVV